MDIKEIDSEELNTLYKQTEKVLKKQERELKKERDIWKQITLRGLIQSTKKQIFELLWLIEWNNKPKKNEEIIIAEIWTKEQVNIILDPLIFELLKLLSDKKLIKIDNINDIKPYLAEKIWTSEAKINLFLIKLWITDDFLYSSFSIKKKKEIIEEINEELIKEEIIEKETIEKVRDEEIKEKETIENTTEDTTEDKKTEEETIEKTIDKEVKEEISIKPAVDKITTISETKEKKVPLVNKLKELFLINPEKEANESNLNIENIKRYKWNKNQLKLTKELNTGLASLYITLYKAWIFKYLSYTCVMLNKNQTKELIKAMEILKKKPEVLEEYKSDNNEEKFRNTLLVYDRKIVTKYILLFSGNEEVIKEIKNKNKLNNNNEKQKNIINTENVEYKEENIEEIEEEVSLEKKIRELLLIDPEKKATIKNLNEDNIGTIIDFLLSLPIKKKTIKSIRKTRNTNKSKKTIEKKLSLEGEVRKIFLLDSEKNVCEDNLNTKNIELYKWDKNQLNLVLKLNTNLSSLYLLLNKIWLFKYLSYSCIMLNKKETEEVIKALERLKENSTIVDIYIQNWNEEKFLNNLHIHSSKIRATFILKLYNTDRNLIWITKNNKKNRNKEIVEKSTELESQLREIFFIDKYWYIDWNNINKTAIEEYKWDENQLKLAEKLGVSSLKKLTNTLRHLLLNIHLKYTTISLDIEIATRAIKKLNNEILDEYKNNYDIWKLMKKLWLHTRLEVKYIFLLSWNTNLIKLIHEKHILSNNTIEEIYNELDKNSELYVWLEWLERLMKYFNINAEAFFETLIKKWHLDDLKNHYWWYIKNY